MAKNKTKIDTLQEVANYLGEIKIGEFFYIRIIEKTTGFQYISIKRALLSFEELGVIKYVAASKSYIKINNIENLQINNIKTQGGKNERVY